MPTFSITLPQLVSDADLEVYVANEAIAAGELFYLDSDGEGNVADNTDGAKDEVEGMALTAADIGNYFVGVNGDGVVIQTTATITQGDELILSTTGDVQLSTDLASTEYLSRFGWVSGTDEITIDIKNTGTQK